MQLLHCAFRKDAIAAFLTLHSRTSPVIQKSSMQVQSVDLSDAAEITRGRAKMEIFGVLGIASQQCASYLIFVTQRVHAATFPQGDVYRAVDVELREVSGES